MPLAFLDILSEVFLFCKKKNVFSTFVEVNDFS